MKQRILHPFIGQKIVQVTYFELNDPEQAFFFDGFDNFDLAIEIEFSNGFYWHIAWKENDRPEVGIGKYIPAVDVVGYKSLDATEKWSVYLGSPIEDFEIIYVNEEWKVPAQCTIQFANSESVSIIPGEELHLDGSLPLPLRYSDLGEMYVFHGKDLPPLELVQIIFPPELDETFLEAFYEEDDLDKPVKSKFTTEVFLGFVFIVILTVVVIRKVVLEL